MSIITLLFLLDIVDVVLFCLMLSISWASHAWAVYVKFLCKINFKCHFYNYVSAVLLCY